MKNVKRILSILIACAMLMMAMPFAVSAAGTQNDPIDAATKWFGYGVDTYLLNPTLAEGNDGIWYTLTADKAGILSLEHSYKDVDYTVQITLNGANYVGGCVDGEPYNRPIVTAPIKEGDVATIQIATKDAAAGTVYASMNIIAGDVDNAVKVKSDGLSVVVGAGQTVYFQDDSLNAIYATKGLLVKGNVANTIFYTVTKNTESGDVTTAPVTDSDKDGIIEAKLGGSLGSAGAPPIKPAWAIENKSAVDQVYTLTIVDTAHECVYDNDADVNCNTCGAVREAPQYCSHEYDNNIDADCNLCGTKREIPFALNGMSVSEDVNGLAVRYDLTVQGMAVDGTKAIYDNATFCGYKLISMGAVVCNNYDGTTAPTIEDANGQRVTNVSAAYLCEFNAETGEASFAIRVVHIPENNKDTTVFFNPYVVIENDKGEKETVYISACVASATYNGVAN